MQTVQSDATFSLRPATREDLPKILEIESRVHTAPWNLNHFEAELEKPYSHFLVLSDDETDEVIAGYLVYWQMEKGDAAGARGEVLNIAVDFPYRRKGLAKRMIQQLVAFAMRQGCRQIVLDVRKTNQAAIQLYQSMRFTITQVRKKFYSNGEDAYGMTLFLDDQGVGVEF